jgi:hypothetical protein
MSGGQRRGPPLGRTPRGARLGCAEAALARLIVITQDALLLARLVSLSRVKPAKHAKKGRSCMSRMHPRLGEYVVGPRHREAAATTAGDWSVLVRGL